MIALTRSGYDKFIKGTFTLSAAKVAVLGEGITNSQWSPATIDTYRSQASTAKPEFPFEDYVARYPGQNFTSGSNGIVIDAKVTLDTMNFEALGDTNVNRQAAVIDTNDGDDPVGMIILYPTSAPITHSALNSNPVNIDYTSGGMAIMSFKTGATPHQYLSKSNPRYNAAETFPKGILKMPIFDPNVSSNMLTDMKIALLSSTDASSTADFNTQLHTDSRVLSTLANFEDPDHTGTLNTRYKYISGGFTFRNLGICTGNSTGTGSASNGYAALSATDTTVFIEGLELDSYVFAVVYFEDRNQTDTTDVMSENYKNNCYILNNVADLVTSSYSQQVPRFTFKQSVIIDTASPLFAHTSTTLPAGILAVTNTVGPGFRTSNVKSENN